MKNILIPIDFSENSINALQYAKTLFSTEICTFYLLNVYITNPSNLLSEEYNNSVLTKMSYESEKDLKLFLNKNSSENDNNNHRFESVFKVNTLVKAINSVVTSKKIDFIIMGTKGANGAKEVFLGSNTVKVINRVENFPVLVVPQNYIPKKPSVITFSTNFKRSYIEKELKPLINIAISNNSKVNIARIMMEEYLNDHQKVNKKTLKVFFKEIDYIFCKIDLESSQTNAIKNFVQQTKSDLIVLIHHKHNFFQKLLEEDVVEKISFNSSIPLLILPELKQKSITNK
ncbi:universal stress protein [uncultured Aquimarina sp.]|uniref:universal stress protein n=1 Tax=uncultured Aquimarina sp. TaxID=575652 RepID=UPI0026092A9B|nr:universal stress protein [uncultured Aquimarina sp.]